MKKEFLSLIILALYILGAVGGLGYAFYCEAYLIGIAVIALAVMALPTAKKHIDILMD